MATVKLPTRTDGTQLYDFEVLLDGLVYLLELRWSERDSSWYLSFLDPVTEDVFAADRKVVLGEPLTARLQDPRLPPGQLVVIDTSGANVEAGLLDLGARVSLVYVEAADVAAL